VSRTKRNSSRIFWTAALAGAKNLTAGFEFYFAEELPPVGDAV
jgi:hypothetical protein